MSTNSRAVAVLLLLATAAHAQRAVGADKPLPFAEAVDKAKAAYKAGSYGACVSALQEALARASAKRAEVIVAAMPAAPDGFEQVPQKKPAQVPAGAAGALAGIAALAGAQTEVESRGPERASIKITVMADSPLGGMAAMMFNPMVVQNEPNAQLFEYDNGHKAVAKVNGDRVSVNALLGGKHMVQLEGRKITKEQAMSMLSQAHMDKLAAAIGS